MTQNNSHELALLHYSNSNSIDAVTTGVPNNKLSYIASDVSGVVN